MRGCCLVHLVFVMLLFFIFAGFGLFFVGVLVALQPTLEGTEEYKLRDIHA